jgi:hypothetical protein
VWIEKDALVGIVENAVEDLGAPCFSCRGYGSATEYWNAAQRIVKKKKPAVILHLGDHDPSGIDMTRDIQARLHLYGADVTIERIALNMPQVQQYQPPPNPAKELDRRFKEYEKKYGSESWELDALEPSLLDELITTNVIKHLDILQFEKAKDQQETERKKLLALCKAKPRKDGRP